MAKQKKQQNTRNRLSAKDAKQKLIDMIEKLDTGDRKEDRKDVNKLFSILRSAEVSSRGVDFDAAGTLHLIYNFEPIRDIVNALSTTDMVISNISIFDKNFRNEKSLKVSKEEMMKTFEVTEKINATLEDVASSIQALNNEALVQGYGRPREVEAAKKEYVKARRDEVFEMAKKGATAEEIAEKINIDVKFVRGYVQEANILKIKESADAITKEAQAGKTPEEIAKKLKIEADTKTFKDIYKKALSDLIDSKKDEIMKLVEEGKTATQIAEDLKVNAGVLGNKIGQWRPKKKKAEKKPQQDKKQEPKKESVKETEKKPQQEKKQEPKKESVKETEGF